MCVRVVGQTKSRELPPEKHCGSCARCCTSGCRTLPCGRLPRASCGWRRGSAGPLATVQGASASATGLARLRSFHFEATPALSPGARFTLIINAGVLPGNPMYVDGVPNADAPAPPCSCGPELSTAHTASARSRAHPPPGAALGCFTEGRAFFKAFGVLNPCLLGTGELNHNRNSPPTRSIAAVRPVPNTCTACTRKSTEPAAAFL